MTSINALRLDFHSGLLLCDEARYWNPEWMIFYTPEKIRRIVNSRITKTQQSVMFMGQTGSSSIGDEWIHEITRAIDSGYEAALKTGKTDAEEFVRLRPLSRLAFQTITRIKHTHIDDFLQGKYGFKTHDLIRGYYFDPSKGKIQISDATQIKNAIKYMNFSSGPEEVKGIYGNSQVLAGYHPQDGFKMFYMTERWPVCEEVHEIFIAQGSGRDTCDLNFARFADTCRLTQRRSETRIDRSKGLFELLKGLEQALKQTAGIGGYPKIIYINGHDTDPAKWVSEISDCRSKLSLEMVSASLAGFIDEVQVEQLLEKLVFQNADFFAVHKEFFTSSNNASGMRRYLRCYS